jgi:hypothetical protein
VKKETTVRLGDIAKHTKANKLLLGKFRYIPDEAWFKECISTGVFF